jgi:hypothetical protein
VEQRRSRRFNLKLPVHIVRAGSLRIAHQGETYNVSAGGVLVSDPGTPVEIGQPVEYFIDLPTGRSEGDVRIRCLGKVVRKDEKNQAIAATLERYEFIRA